MAYGLLALSEDIANIACAMLAPASSLGQQSRSLWLETIYEICQLQCEIFGPEEEDGLIIILQKRGLADTLTDLTGEAAELAEALVEMLERAESGEDCLGLVESVYV